ncbi:MAG: hypothetical protein ACN6O2_10455, partial [Stenotrophomonas sp.]
MNVLQSKVGRRGVRRDAAVLIRHGQSPFVPAPLLPVSRLTTLLLVKHKSEGRALPGLAAYLLDIQSFNLLPRHADLRQPGCRT